MTDSFEYIKTHIDAIITKCVTKYTVKLIQNINTMGLIHFFTLFLELPIVFIVITSQSFGLF